MSKSRGTMVVRIPSLEPHTFSTWDEFIQAWTEYMAQTKTLYRRRSSCSTSSWNNKNRFKKFPVPDSFQYATMAYWCTHGCIQPSRGTGVRAHLHNRFTGCMARITVEVVYEKRDESKVSQHNHKINDEIFNCYMNNSSIPDELLLGTLEELEEDLHESHTPTPSSAEHDTASVCAAESPLNGSTLLGKELLDDWQKSSMARTVLQPLLDDLNRTPSRVIHKRLQDVSEMVVHLLGKWERGMCCELRASPRVCAIQSE
ncbi:TPA: hypothetical protein N0F65_012164 [Lagenidium giganteum]|uniref:Uncharacterized protein n=1 Tax=Lagenidium giganteum TaxID=4803 RepID=A0AAV2YW54_9STRA|nr:TPA: hypothetical protein N0F65_012164 [Lagenidium giganteum]